MEEYYYKRSYVPAFGSWDCNESLPFTECFESARRTGLLRYSYSESEDRDLHVTGDLYDNDGVTSAIIVVPRTKAKLRNQKEKDTKRKSWVNNVDNELFSPTPKPVDDDLYKISPKFLYTKVKKRRGLCFFCGCF